MGMPTADLVVRPARVGDVPAVAEIFGWYVANSVATFEVEAPTAADWQQRLAALSAAGWPFLVGTVAGRVVGYCYVAPWRPKPAYRHTVESSVYVAPGEAGRGYGRTLLASLLAAAAAAGAYEVVAVIADSGSPASASLHRALGFIDAGRLSRVGFKHGRWLDVTLLQASLPRNASPPSG